MMLYHHIVYGENRKYNIFLNHKIKIKVNAETGGKKNLTSKLHSQTLTSDIQFNIRVEQKSNNNLNEV